MTCIKCFVLNIVTFLTIEG